MTSETGPKPDQEQPQLPNPLPAGTEVLLLEGSPLLDDKNNAYFDPDDCCLVESSEPTDDGYTYTLYWDRTLMLTETTPRLRGAVPGTDFKVLQLPPEQTLQGATV